MDDIFTDYYSYTTLATTPFVVVSLSSLCVAKDVAIYLF